MMEEQTLLKAAEEVLRDVGEQSMHYTEIKQHLIQRNILSPGSTMTIEAALCHDTQSANNKFALVPGKPGYFSLAQSKKPAEKIQPSQLKTQLKKTPGKPAPVSKASHILRISPPPKTSLKMAGLKTASQLTSPKQISPKVTKETTSSLPTTVSKPHLLKTSGITSKLGLKSNHFPKSQLMLKRQGKRKLLGHMMSSPVVQTNGTNNSKYERRYKRLKKMVKDMIFMNAAVCDEAFRIEEKIVILKEERRYLLKRLMKQQALSEVLNAAIAKQNSTTSSKHTSSQSINEILTEIEKKNKKKTPPAALKANKTARQLLDEKPKPKKKTKADKRLVQPISLDNTGRPVLPIELGHLTVYCLGEVNFDRPGFHTTDYIFPIGYYSTRIYLSPSSTQKSCLYNCKILDGGTGPKFEIAMEGDDQPSHLYTGYSASECHNKLLQDINQSRGHEVAPLGDKGADFFGFAHPSIQNLIQSLPGARKCNRYRWVKFEVNRDGVYYIEEDITVNLDAVLAKMPSSNKPVTSQAASNETEETISKTVATSSSLRNLLSISSS